MTTFLMPEDVGFFAIGMSIYSIAITVSMLGLRQGMLRYIPYFEDGGEKQKIYGVMIGGLSLTGFTSLLIAILLYFTADILAVNIFHDSSLVPIFRILSFAIPLTVITQFLVSVAQSLKHVEYQAIITQMIVPLLRIIVFVFIIYFLGRKLLIPPFAVTISAFIGFVIASIGVWRLYPIKNLKSSEILFSLKIIIAFSLPLLLDGLVNIALNETETIILGTLLGSGEVGIYYISLRIALLLGVPLLIFAPIFAPVMAGLHRKNEIKHLGNLFKTVTKWGFSICFPAFLFVVAFSENILRIFGDDYVTGSSVLQLLAISQLFSVSVGLVGWMLIMSGHSLLNLLNSIIILCLNIVSVLVLAPKFGIIGAAIGGFITTIIVNTMRVLQVRYLLKFHPFNKNFLKPLIAGMVAVVISIWINTHISFSLNFLGLSVQFFIIFAIYGVVLIMLKFDNDDQIVINAIFRRLPFFRNL